MIQNETHEKLTNFLAETLQNISKFEEYLVNEQLDDISFKEIRVLETVARMMKNQVPARATEIAAALFIAPSTFTTTADSLEKKGYLSRMRDENDHRSVRVALTDKGISTIMQHLDFHKEAADEILARMNPVEVQALMQAMEILQEYYLKKKTTPKSNKVKIIVDGSCDLSPEAAAQLGVSIIPMKIAFGDEEYRQNLDLSAAQFYEKLAGTKTLPTTTQLTPYDLEQVFKEETKDGSEVVAIHLSSAMSGTYHSAYLASREVTGVYPVNSQSSTIGMALLAKIAAKQRAAGKSAQEIATILAEFSERIIVLAYIPTLKYLVRGGRLSATAGVVGEAMNMYPLISVHDGVVESIDKARGKNAARKKIAKLVAELGIEGQYGIVYAHASAPEELEALKIHLKELTADCESTDCEIGAVIGTHTGPGAVGIAFVMKEKTTNI